MTSTTTNEAHEMIAEAMIEIANEAIARRMAAGMTETEAVEHWTRCIMERAAVTA